MGCKRSISESVFSSVVIIVFQIIFCVKILFFFFWIRGNPTSRKTHFVGPGERVKPRLSQTLTRSARPDSNSRPAVQISNPLPPRYTPWGQFLKPWLSQSFTRSARPDSNSKPAMQISNPLPPRYTPWGQFHTFLRKLS